MKRWSDAIDPQSIPDPVLKSEVARRSSAKRKTFGAGTGRPKKLTTCPACGLTFGAVEMRKHKHKGGER